MTAVTETFLYVQVRYSCTGRILHLFTGSIHKLNLRNNIDVCVTLNLQKVSNSNKTLYQLITLISRLSTNNYCLLLICTNKHT